MTSTKDLTPEDRLARAFAFDEPSARDLTFTVAVMERVARRRLWVSLAMMVPPALVAAILLWAVVPILQPLTESVAQGVWPAVPVLIVAGLLALISWRVLAPGEL